MNVSSDRTQHKSRELNRWSFGSFFVAALVLASIWLTPGFVRADSALLSTSDLSCAGVFLTPGVEQGPRSLFPITYRYEADGKRHYFMYDGRGHIVQFPEPALSPCNTPLTSVTRATFESWGGDWGEFAVNGGDNYVPGNNSTFGFGLFYDQALSQLILNWTQTYAYTSPHNTFAAVTLNDTTHQMSRVGCWGVAGTTMPLVGSGIVNIPSSFVSANLPAGMRYGIGFGGALSSYTAGISLGPTLTAIAPGAPNACAPGTDYFVPSGPILARYPINNNGPTCWNVGMGCTPAQAPTAPYPAKIAMANYSKDMYAADWDPWNGKGYFGFGTGFGVGWYDDGLKGGVIVPVSAPEGWARTQILSNPPPSALDYSEFLPRGTMYVQSTSTHDGFNINPGDKIWALTCRLGVDPGCDSAANGRNYSIMTVDAVVPATGRIDFRVVDPDFGSGDHRPVPGGLVHHGCIYMHGAPDCSRTTLRLQIYNPNQYAQVIAGTRHSYDVEYTEDVDLNSMVTGFGSPASGSGVSPRHAAAVMTDPSKHQVMFSYVHGNNPPYAISHAVYVFNVASTPGGPTARLTASPSSVQSGQPSTLSWTTTGATTVNISPDVGAVGASGSRVVSPSRTTTYLLTATNSIGTVTSQAGVYIAAATCPNGLLCNNTSHTGVEGQVVCGSDLKNWECTSSGWHQLNTSCTCSDKIPSAPQQLSIDD